MSATYELCRYKGTRKGMQIAKVQARFNLTSLRFKTWFGRYLSMKKLFKASYNPQSRFKKIGH